MQVAANNGDTGDTPVISYPTTTNAVVPAALVGIL
jgi:hypothetical protein